MEKEFVPYELSLQLKELGFDYPCIMCYYGISNADKDKKERLYLSSGMGKVCNSHLIEKENGITAPLFQQVFRWFREKYNLHPSFTRYKSSSVNREPTIFSDLYKIHIIDENADKIFYVGDFNSFEEAEVECLKKLIEICKKN